MCKHVLGVFIFILGSTCLYACDVCGGSSATYNFGSGVFDSKYIIGLRYSSDAYRSTHLTLSDEEVPVVSNELFTSYSLLGKFFFQKNWATVIILPYRVNNREELTTSAKVNGLGDISAGLSFSFKSMDKDKHKLSHEIGALLQMPTGNYTQEDEYYETTIENMQLGNGAWNTSPFIRSVYKSGKWTLSNNLTYTITTKNKEEYKFGNQLQANLNALYKIPTKNEEVSLFPLVGLSLLDSQRDLDDSFDGINNYSGGTTTFLKLGFETLFNRFYTTAHYSLPLTENRAQGHVETKHSINFSINYRL